MYFHSFSAFIAMGGHGFYVWSAYGITLVLVTLDLWLARRRHRKVVLDLRRRLRREQAGQEGTQ